MNVVASNSVIESVISEALELIDAGKPIRIDFEKGGRLHIDRPLPFLCVHIGEQRVDSAAADIVSSNASYLLAPDLSSASLISTAITAAMRERFASFLVVDAGELDQDNWVSEDAPYLPPFEITLSATDDIATNKARDTFELAVKAVVARFRSPNVTNLKSLDDSNARLAASVSDGACLTVRFAPIYRVPHSNDVYVDLRERVIANIFDACLQAIAAFLKSDGTLELSSHRALGRRAFIDAVEKADEAIDNIVSTFDFLLAVTPINSEIAWQEFSAGAFQHAPRLLYRPLTVQIDGEKKRLFSIAFKHFEDPVLADLYREKQQELDLQLSMLGARDTPRFLEFSRALYGRVEPELFTAAQQILAVTQKPPEIAEPGDNADCYQVQRAARVMIDHYRRSNPAFQATVEIRDDLPAGLMVSGSRLLISRSTHMTSTRLTALLSHEVGVHLLTYFNGSAQGLRIFRSGLSGYEGLQEGLAVFAEYLVGGMTHQRMRLLAGRVIACAHMLEGASFNETFRVLVHQYEFSPPVAFNISLRVHRGGGLAKDAIYLRGLLEVLDHLKKGGILDVFWMGKVASCHFGVMQELNSRGLLKPPLISPAFLHHSGASQRLDRARSGLTPAELVDN